MFMKTDEDAVWTAGVVHIARRGDRCTPGRLIKLELKPPHSSYPIMLSYAPGEMLC